ncbi:dipeptidase [Thalassomonas sp. M1454]|uniref:dipeptidase n=1 Tax=Thalassomonas sp. M1454 TaxID=2594477 RepID=UPI001180EC39|nr:membrane dipeptidase [Thalassomonas sp. M1454]TRX53434.1 hypothetical protein FNN08_14265 [Thalassomonas sp. M1454]
MNLKQTLTISLSLVAMSCSADSTQKVTKVEYNKEKMQQSMLEPVPFIDKAAKARPALDASSEEIEAYVQYLYDVSVPRTPEEIAGDKAVMARYKDAYNLDSLFIGTPAGFPAMFTPEQFDVYAGLSKKANFDALSLTISNGSDSSIEYTYNTIQKTTEYIKKHSDKYLHITTISDFEKAKKEGKLGIHYNFQSMNAFGDESNFIENIRKYYELGIRQVNFTYNKDNLYGGGGVSNGDGSNDGVSELGVKAIQEMNKLGMIVDCSHSSNQTCIDASVASAKPVIMSHSNVGTLMPIDRNVSDQAMRAIASTGGVICTNFIGGFLNKHAMARPTDIAKHVQYVRDLVGVEATCAGSDYVYNLNDLNKWILANPDQFPPEMGYASPSQLGLPSEIWGVVRVLEDRYNWTEEEVRMFLGDNLLRVYAANWK